jgi:5-(aminomethyl)-3-furanmethanol phosphate kinase
LHSRKHMKPLILKLGGSLTQTGQFQSIIALTTRAQRPVIIVPGGGPFADSVRALQPKLGFDDPTAHAMALLSMDQMGLYIASLDPALITCQTLQQFAHALQTGKIPVWLPYLLQHNDATLPTDWTVTSDTLAARLAERILGASVALVKSCPVPLEAGLDRLTELGIVDPAFAPTVRRTHLTWGVYGAGDEPLLAKRLLTNPSP